MSDEPYWAKPFIFHGFEGLWPRANKALLACEDIRASDLTESHTAKQSNRQIANDPFHRCDGIGKRTANELVNRANDL